MRVSGLVRWIIVGVGLAISPHVAVAGGGPETTLVVVNADSPLSMRIGNAYATIRDIPQTHLVWLHDVPSLGAIDVEIFRDRIWRPVRDYISNHGMEDQIDTIAYSSDFPYAVNIKSDIKAKKLPKNRYRGKFASLTGLTYFARRVEIGDAGYLNLYANLYYRRNLAPGIAQASLTEDQQQLAKDAARALKDKKYESAVRLYRKLAETGTARAWYELARSLVASGQTDEALAALEKAVDSGWPNSMIARGDHHLKSLRALPRFPTLLERMEARNGPFEPAHGFRSRYFWDRWALPSPSNAATNLNRYYLSTLLGYTGPHGNSVPEILSYLGSAAASDGSRPDGTIYLMVNNNIRSQARQRFFPATVRMLEERNRRVEILTRGKDGQKGIIPLGKDDVIGAVVGAKGFDWKDSKSTLLPGAIAESLTSYGGHFNSRKQTKLTEFLRRGAAGSSGAVAEPYSIQEKFPVAMLHGYYAEGSSLAEAFYQSISGPYQLIIVGDPLARPFAHFAEVELTEPGLSLPWRGAVNIRARVIPATKRPIDRVELWVDGVQVAGAPVGQSMAWDTRSVEDGSHEIRLVAVEAGRIETRSYAKFQISIANTGNHIQVHEAEVETRLGELIELSGQAPNASHVDAMRGSRVLASAPVLDGAWQLSLPSAMIGLGKSPIFIRAMFPGTSVAHSRPVTVRVLEPPLSKASVIDDNISEGLRAMLVSRDGIKRDIVLKALDGKLRLLAKDQKDQVQSLRLEGKLKIRESGFYQFVISTRGRLRIKIDNHDFGERIVEATNNEVFLPLSLEAGWHRLYIELVPDGRPHLKIVVAGNQVAEVLAGKILRHVIH